MSGKVIPLYTDITKSRCLAGTCLRAVLVVSELGLQAAMLEVEPVRIRRQCNKENDSAYIAKLGGLCGLSSLSTSSSHIRSDKDV